MKCYPVFYKDHFGKENLQGEFTGTPHGSTRRVAWLACQESINLEHQSSVLSSTLFCRSGWSLITKTNKLTQNPQRTIHYVGLQGPLWVNGKPLEIWLPEANRQFTPTSWASEDMRRVTSFKRSKFILHSINSPTQVPLSKPCWLIQFH